MIKDGDKDRHRRFYRPGIRRSFQSGSRNPFESGIRATTIMFSAGIGDGTDRLGLNKLGHKARDC